MSIEAHEVFEQTKQALQELFSAERSGLRPVRTLAIGCSSSEIAGGTIGHASAYDLGEAVAEVTFQRNIVTGAEAGSCLYMSLYEGRNIGGGHFLGSSDWVLTPVSAMNSDGSMNSAAP